PDLDALRAAVSRIENGESTGLFDDATGSQTRRADRQAPAPQRDTPREPSRPEATSGDRAAVHRHAAAHQDTLTHDTVTPANHAPDDTKPPSDPTDERDADPYAVARAIVLRQLTMSPKSRHQLREKLRQRDCPDDVAEAVLDRLTAVGLVDDAKYAESLVRSKQVTRGLSKRALAHELRTKGVDRDTAGDILDQVSDTEEEERARTLVEGRLPRLRALDKEVVVRRLAGLLARKGYPSGLSLRVIREALDADPAFRRD
ncbi:MAG: regulatory protein RecX, partial [Dermatophilaceae bacterium]